MGSEPSLEPGGGGGQAEMSEPEPRPQAQELKPIALCLEAASRGEATFSSSLCASWLGSARFFSSSSFGFVTESLSQPLPHENRCALPPVAAVWCQEPAAESWLGKRAFDRPVTQLLHLPHGRLGQGQTW